MTVDKILFVNITKMSYFSVGIGVKDDEIIDIKNDDVSNNVTDVAEQVIEDDQK